MFTFPWPQTDVTNQAVARGQTARLVANDDADEIERVLRALDEALIEDERAEALAQFDRAVVLLAKTQRWHAGLAAARQVYAAVTRWEDFDAAPYALTVAQFAHNYAIELQQARLFEVAGELFSEALALFERCGDTARQMVTAHQLGRARQSRGEYIRAEEAYQSSLEIARARSDLAHIASNLFQLGQLAQLTGQAEESESLYREVIALAERIPSPSLLVAAAQQLGVLAHTRAEYGEAERWFEFELKLARQYDDNRGITAALHQLGMVAHEQGDYWRAEQLYLASLTQAADPADRVPTLYQLAQAASARGDNDGAERYGNECLNLVQQQGDIAAIQRVKDRMGRLEFRRSGVASCQKTPSAEC